MLTHYYFFSKNTGLRFFVKSEKGEKTKNDKISDQAILKPSELKNPELKRDRVVLPMYEK